jgi:hypothetical protein
MLQGTNFCDTPPLQPMSGLSARWPAPGRVSALKSIVLYCNSQLLQVLQCHTYDPAAGAHWT